MIIIVPFQSEKPEDAVQRKLRSCFALPAWFGLVSRVNALGSLLQQISDHVPGRAKNGRAYKPLQLLDGDTVGLSSLETGHQVLDFLVLGEADLGRDLCGLSGSFFFTPIFNWARVCSMIC